MGMASLYKTPTLGEIRHKLYPNLIHCKNCDALYSKGKYCKVRYDEGTSGAYQVLGNCKDNACPICGVVSNITEETKK